MPVNLSLQINEKSKDFTTAERKIAAVLLSDYPFAGLETIHVLAERAHVSAPTITRFVQKFNCNGYQEFQRCLISELKEGQQSPIDLRRRSMPVDDGFLQTFLKRSSEVYMRVGEGVTDDQFKRISGMLADRKRNNYHIGGRISDAISQYLSRHLRQIRNHVYHLPSDPEVWPEYLLRIRSRDIVVMLDFRRYEPRLLALAERAEDECGAQIILITDKWLSPIARHAKEVIALPIESGTAWDTYCGALGLIEALITHIAEQDWEATQQRIGNWDKLRLNY